jgi:ABC-type uncharacterized transport system permease subunit
MLVTIPAIGHLELTLPLLICVRAARVYEWQALLYSSHQYPGVPILLVGFLCSFALSFAVGANDSANEWGTSLGRFVCVPPTCSANEWGTSLG